MELNTISNTGSWGNSANRLNENFSKVNTEVEKLKNATTKNKGYFTTEEALRAAYPTPADGMYAWVGTPYPGTVYESTGGAWGDTGQEPDTESVNLNEYAKVKENQNESDLSITDEKGYSIAEFSNGHVRTKSFDSSKTAKIDNNEYDFSISDENGNEIARFSNGHVRTKNFDSSKIAVKEKKLNGKKIAFLGDSITFGYLVTAETVYHAVLSKISGCISKNLGVSSTGLCTNMKNNMSSQRFITRVTEENLLDQDLIVIFGGTNDFSYDNKAIGSVFTETTIFSDTYIGTKKLVATTDTDTFDGAMHELIAEIRSITSAPIIFITPLKRGRYSTGRPTSSETNINGNYLKDYSDTIKKVCEFYSIPVLDLFSNSNLDLENESIAELYSEDSLHPNTDGHRVIAELLYRFITNNINI